MIHTLSSKINQRKSRLNIYLNNNHKDLKPEKKHQISGAIAEMDNILEILKKHKNKEVHLENNPEDEVFLFRPIHDKGLIHNVKEYVKGLF